MDNRDPNAFIVEDSKLLVVNSGRAHPNTAESPNRFVLKRPVPDGDWDAVIRFNAEFKTGKDLLWFGLWTDAENYLGGQIFTNRTSNIHCPNVTLRNRKNSSGKETSFDVMIFECGGSWKEWLANMANKPHTLGLHKRGRDYYVTLGVDGVDGEREYKTDSLTSLRLPGKALAIVVGKWDAKRGGEMQALIDSIEITRVSK